MEGSFDELRAYVGFEPRDAELLAALWPHVDPRMDRVVDHFYERVMANEGTRGVLDDDAQMRRLMRTLARWIEELLCGPHDAAYVERRIRIGRRHVEVGLPPRFLYPAMQVLAEDLSEIAREVQSLDLARETGRSIQRATSVELALMTASYVDERERLALAALQQLLLHHLRVTILLVNDAGTITAATRPATALFGDDVQGRTWQDVVPAPLRDAAALDTLIAEAGRSGVEVIVDRVDVATEDGLGVRSYRVSVVPLQHELARFLLQVEDLTSTVEVGARLRHSESLAELGAMSATVAHELRNPLAGISGAIQVIRRATPESSPHAAIMAKVEGEIRRLDALVHDLLAFGRHRTPVMKPIDLAECARFSVELASETHPEVRFEVEGEGRVSADATVVRQILLNLLRNAAQAAGDGGAVRIVLSDRRVEVLDTGPGVAADQLERVFQPFYTTRTRGTGLGLPVSRRAAASMGARLFAQPGPGGRFVLAFS